MSPDALSVAGLVAVLLPTLYFLIASPTFLLAKFDDPVVTSMFRGLLSFHFRLIAIGSAAGLVAFSFAGRPIFAIALAVIGALAIAVRHWFLSRMDAELKARDRGDARAVGRMRGLHWRGMAYNAMQLTALVVINPFVLAKVLH